MKNKKRFWLSVFIGVIVYFMALSIAFITTRSSSLKLAVLVSSLATGYISHEKGWLSGSAMMLISSFIPVVFFAVIAVIFSFFSQNTLEAIKYIPTLFSKNLLILTFVQVFTGGLIGILGEKLYKIIKS